jgi:hypothetical protein
MCVPRSNYDLVNLIREKLHGAVRNYSNNLEQFMQKKANSAQNYIMNNG